MIVKNTVSGVFWLLSRLSFLHSRVLAYHCFTDWEQHAGDVADEREGIGALSSTFLPFLN